MEPTTVLEKQRAHTIAQEYRSKGYDVIEEPASEQLPDFLSGYRPDLLIRKDNETVVVEVKTRSSLVKDPSVRDLARLIQAEPDWSFELVVVDEEEKLGLPEGAHPSEREYILQLTEETERLLELGFARAALVQAWSISEAAIRVLLEEEGISIDRLAPSYILNQAATEGVISRDDYRFLTKAMKYRNALVHGFRIDDFDYNLIGDLIRTTKNILHSATAP
ncbi:MAG: hypothetical protein IIB15_02275 [Chloroflexi bacterium]|nr:hypothetical protein [Chloroflexota bacterium]